MKVMALLGILVLASACSSIQPVEEGKIYRIQCHKMVYGEDSCAELAKEKCLKGYEIISKDSTYELFRGPQRAISVRCKQ